MSIPENIRDLKVLIPSYVRVVAVSKTRSVEEILEAYRAGHRLFGENKVQEMTAKQPGLPADIQWHFVGHLQTNKVKYIAPFVSMIHSVDSMKLLGTIDKEAKKNDRILPCLLQVNISQEDTKFGLTEDQVADLLASTEYSGLSHIRIDGVMGMASYTNNSEQIRREFRNLKEIFLRIKNGYFSDSETFREISMGMSGDYKIAVEEGSTMIRIGTLIFGPRFKKL